MRGAPLAHDVVDHERQGREIAVRNRVGAGVLQFGRQEFRGQRAAQDELRGMRRGGREARERRAGHGRAEAQRHDGGIEDRGVVERGVELRGGVAGEQAAQRVGVGESARHGIELRALGGVNQDGGHLARITAR
ncbi:MAG: hypothetical protein IPG43_24070 [Proteobacteria bacterium]|nr:hypothetical protein [Pseudomonadota bacterium]